MTIYYAGFTEYGDLFPTTIRNTYEEACAAACEMFNYDPKKEDQWHGLCIGKITESWFSHVFSVREGVEIEWVGGWRKK